MCVNIKPNAWNTNVCDPKNQHSIRCAIELGAWDALDWVARQHLYTRRLYGVALYANDLAELVNTGGTRELQFVALWLDARLTPVTDDFKGMLLAACEVGAVQVLQAWGRRYAEKSHLEDDFSSTDAMVKAAVFGRGPAAPVLDLMKSRPWDMCNVAEYAAEAGNQDALEWSMGIDI
ncbi:hypothetical protein BCR44DRAFT_1434327 [Catenaria anguillulae PL171]|uniref:Ankyrin repeat-containing domain protein n=1 Tax=Catenaria anguillulae PL171 TaxID=765915 RepID=A0A1Y2HLK0_9FUNG|nr:hypothetical protein BCR44DRAFT_1434327 [Catenaria anguillulae PL171]